MAFKTFSVDIAGLKPIVDTYKNKYLVYYYKVECKTIHERKKNVNTHN